MARPWCFVITMFYCICFVMTVTGLISCSLERIFGHIGVRSNNTATITMLKICLNLIQDSDFNVRELFR